MKKKCTLHQSVCTVLDDLETTCTAGFHAKSKENVVMNYFSILASDCQISTLVRTLVRLDTGCLREDEALDV